MCSANSDNVERVFRALGGFVVSFDVFDGTYLLNSSSLEANPQSVEMTIWGEGIHGGALFSSFAGIPPRRFIEWKETLLHADGIISRLVQCLA